MNLQYHPVRRKNADVDSPITLIDAAFLSTLVSDGSILNTQAEKFRTFLLKSDVNLFNHLAKAMAHVVLALFFVDTRLVLIEMSLICIV